MNANLEEKPTASVFVWLQVPGLMKFLYKSQTTGVFVHVRLRQAETLRVSLFETDMGELLFSGLTPNLPLMDRPPNSQLL